MTDKLERRRGPRIKGFYPAIVRSVDVEGRPFTEYAVIENISAYGTYLHLRRQVKPGTRIFAVVRLLVAPFDTAPRPRIALRGRVVRLEHKLDGTYGIGVAITHHRFLYSSGF